MMLTLFCLHQDRLQDEEDDLDSDGADDSTELGPHRSKRQAEGGGEPSQLGCCSRGLKACHAQVLAP